MVDGATVGEFVGDATGRGGLVGCVAGTGASEGKVGNETGISTGAGVACGGGGIVATGELVFLEGGTISTGGKSIAGAKDGDEVEGWLGEVGKGVETEGSETFGKDVITPFDEGERFPLSFPCFMVLLFFRFFVFFFDLLQSSECRCLPYFLPHSE